VDMGTNPLILGNFNPTDSYPDPAFTRGSNFLVSVSATVTIQRGEWTMWIGSDDGRILNMPGIEFYSVFNNDLSDGGQGTGIIGFEKTARFSYSLGTFSVAVETTLDLYAMFWENKGNDGFELAVAEGSKTNAADFQILGNGVLGWAVNSSLP
jgi:hypothetical protein